VDEIAGPPTGDEPGAAPAGLAVTGRWPDPFLELAPERLRALFDQDLVAVLEVGLTGRVLAANDAVAALLGHRPEQLLTLTSEELTHPEALGGCDELRRTVLENGHWAGERLARRSDGSALPVRAAITLVRDGEGKPHHFAGVMVDDTRWKAAEQALWASEEQLRRSFDGALIGICLISLQPADQGRLLRVNAALCDFLGYGEPELLGMTYEDLAHGDDLGRCATAFAAMASGTLPVWRAEQRFRHADGELRWGLVSAAVVCDQEGWPTHAVSQIEDITARKEAEDRLVRQALHDGLTGLANRLLLYDHLRHALARAERTGTLVGVLFLDLDNFKSVNDALGHAAGDDVLVEVAHRLEGALRGSDLAARIGGDEFAVVCEDVTGVEDISPLAQRLLHLLTRDAVLHGHQIPLSASIGVALSGPGSRPEDLFRDADAAMCRVKNRGKAGWALADDELHAAATRLLGLESGLRRALADAELELHYQPMVDLRTLDVVGAEALLRWRHPERGLLLPGEFLDVAEDRRLIGPIGAWVIEQACVQAAAWYARFGDRAPTVAVNVSSGQVGRHEHQVLTLAREAIARTGLPPERLCLEITERQAIDLAGSGAGELYALAEQGIRLAVDDFGTGYSGFGYLRRLPLHVLKIDRSFVGGLGRDRTDTAITRSLVALGRALGLTVVAEGVENTRQRDLLRELDCSQAQGWLWWPALPEAELEALLETGRSPA
jgi:diguanylate cyclase (GGDEF)-like protein/PAS domain S-box-containing protein